MEKNKTKENLKSSQEILPQYQEHKRPNGLVRVIYEQGNSQSQKDFVQTEGGEKREDRLIKDIFFIQDDGKEISFREHLAIPSDVRMSELQGFWKNITRYLPEEKIIVMTKLVISVDSETDKIGLSEFFETDRSLYAFLHELGHVQQPYNKRYEELEDLAIEGGLTDKEVEEYLQIVLGAERGAHNFAIKKLRQLRREGIDLEPSLKTLGDIGRFVSRVLSGYEKLAK